MAAAAGDGKWLAGARFLVGCGGETAAFWDYLGADTFWSDGQGPAIAPQLGRSPAALKLTWGIWAYALSATLMWGMTASSMEWRLSIIFSDGYRSHLPLSVHY